MHLTLVTYSVVMATGILYYIVYPTLNSALSSIPCIEECIMPCIGCRICRIPCIGQYICSILALDGTFVKHILHWTEHTLHWTEHTLHWTVHWLSIPYIGQYISAATGVLYNTLLSLV